MADNIETVGTETTPSPPGDAALSALSKSDDATRYIEERQSQEAEDKGQEPETPKQDRQNHIEQALEEARARSRQARETEHQLDQGLEQAEREWQAQEQQEQA